MLFEEQKSESKAKKLFRSAVYWAQLHKKKEEIRMPQIATYVHQVGSRLILPPWNITAVLKKQMPIKGQNSTLAQMPCALLFFF